MYTHWAIRRYIFHLHPGIASNGFKESAIVAAQKVIVRSSFFKRNQRCNSQRLQLQMNIVFFFNVMKMFQRDVLEFKWNLTCRGLAYAIKRQKARIWRSKIIITLISRYKKCLLTLILFWTEIEFVLCFVRGFRGVTPTTI